MAQEEVAPSGRISGLCEEAGKRLQIETNSQQMLIFMSGAYAAAASAGSENKCEALSRLRNLSSPAFCCERRSQFNRRRQEGILGDSSRRAVEGRGSLENRV